MTEYFVDLAGDDSNTGLIGDPVLTWAEAWDKASANAGTHTVNISDGTYEDSTHGTGFLYLLSSNTVDVTFKSVSGNRAACVYQPLSSTGNLIRVGACNNSTVTFKDVILDGTLITAQAFGGIRCAGDGSNDACNLILDNIVLSMGEEYALFLNFTQSAYSLTIINDSIIETVAQGSKVIGVEDELIFDASNSFGCTLSITDTLLDHYDSTKKIMECTGSYADITFERCVMNNHSSWGGSGESIDSLTINACTITSGVSDHLLTGNQSETSPTITNITITNNTLTSTTVGAFSIIDFDNVSLNFTITGNTINSKYHGIRLGTQSGSTAGSFDQILIDDNVITIDTVAIGTIGIGIGPDSAIPAAPFGANCIKNNTLNYTGLRAGHGILCGGGTGGTEVSFNTNSGAAITDDANSSNLGIVLKGRGCIVHHNHMHGMVALRVKGASNNTIQYNTFHSHGATSPTLSQNFESPAQAESNHYSSNVFITEGNTCIEIDPDPANDADQTIVDNTFFDYNLYVSGSVSILLIKKTVDVVKTTIADMKTYWKTTNMSNNDQSSDLLVDGDINTGGLPDQLGNGTVVGVNGPGGTVSGGGHRYESTGGRYAG